MEKLEVVANEGMSVDVTDFLESAALIENIQNYSTATCNGKPCVSCGGGCYGCKGAEETFYSQKEV